MQSTSRLVRALAALAGLALSLLGAPAHAAGASYPALFVFGDSLVDVGNDLILSTRLGFTPAIPPSTSPHRTYMQGRFSNGPVAPEHLWQRLSGHAPGSAKALKPALALTRVGAGQSVDFAFGGAGTGLTTRIPLGIRVPGLLGQVAAFQAFRIVAKVAGPALYLIAVGSNDYLFADVNGAITPAESVGNIDKAIRQLHALGARNFLVVNVPDLGSLPLVAPSPGLSSLAAEHNSLLASMLQGLRGTLRDARITAFDLRAAQSAVLPTMDPTPALELVQPGASACLFVNPASCPDVPDFGVGTGHFYWDLEHPTSDTHRRLGDLLYEALR